MTIEELIEELRKLPTGSWVAETSGWNEPPPVMAPCQVVFLKRGFTVHIRLPDRVVDMGAEIGAEIPMI